VHRLSSSFVLAYHGCKRSVGEKLLAGESFVPSENDYDWLGSGIYFWESNPGRALDWAFQLKQRNKWPASAEPFVVGAVIDFGYCLDLLTERGLKAVKATYDIFKQDINRDAGRMPVNSGGDDLLFRPLDCAVINYLHTIQAQSRPDALIDTVRGVFIEGAPLYETSGFREKTHIQICVRNPAIIKGVFRVPSEELRMR
jgi:hypothetical protein